MAYASFTCFLTATVVLFTGCVAAPTVPTSAVPKSKLHDPKEISGGALDSPEHWGDDAYPLSHNWDAYRKNLDQLVGGLVVLAPAPGNSNQTAATFLGRVLTDAAKTNVQSQVFDEQLYAAKVTGSFAANLSFGFGRVSFATTNLYDLTLKDSNGVTIPPDQESIDTQRIKELAENIPETFYAVLFATAIKHAVLTTRTFSKISTDGDASYSIIKVDGNYYTSDERTQIDHILIAVGLNRSGSFGNYDKDAKIYRKKAADQIVFSNLKPRGHSEPLNSDYIRKVIATSLKPADENH